MPSWKLEGKAFEKKLGKILLLGVVIGLGLILCLSNKTTPYGCDSYRIDLDAKIDVREQVPLLASDPAISINGDPDLATQTNNTFVIANKTIDATGASQHGISISNTETPFEIRNCTIKGVTVVSALLLYYVSNCTLTDVRVISNDQIGLELYHVYNITVFQCNITDSWKGITLAYSSRVEVSNSTIQSNAHTGISIGSSSRNNKIYWNAFDSNYISARDDDATLSNNFTQNFWSDYLGVDVDPQNKIGDSPHVIPQSEGNTDPIPFMLPPDRPPVYWRSSPIDEVREYGDSIVIELNAAVNGGLKGWYLNDSRFSISDIGTIANDDWIPVGYHGFNVTVINLYDDVLTGLFTLHVEDTILPTWIEIPTNQVVEIGEPFLYDVNATDLSIPLYYWLESSPYFDINSASGEIQNNDTLPAYIAHPVHVFVRDAEGLQIDALFTVTPEDTRPPVWSEPLSNQIIEYGFTLSYDIDASDFSGLDTWFLNDTRFQIDSSGVLTNATNLDIGTYALEVCVNDTVGNILTGIVTIAVQDTIPPEWVLWPTNQILERGSPFSLQLAVSDNHEVAYWTVSDKDNFDITTLGLLFNIRSLDEVAYTLIITAYDASGNSVYASFSITIQDTIDPTWQRPLANYTFELGNLVRIPLDAHDYSGITGWSIDEYTHFSIDDTGVVRNATSLSVGTYTVHVSVSDVIGHILYGTFTIRIQDTTAPTWTKVPSDLYITAPDILAYQLSTFDYSGIDRWEVNDTENFAVNQQGVFIGLRALPAGIYIVEITAYDQYDNHATATITIHAFGHDITILALGAGLWGIAGMFALLVIYKFKPEGGLFSWKRGGA
ncbi:MAG: NosD domain-containing protein [Candidatus Sifarchaeia archaeon]